MLALPVSAEAQTDPPPVVRVPTGIPLIAAFNHAGPITIEGVLIDVTEYRAKLDGAVVGRTPDSARTGTDVQIPLGVLSTSGLRRLEVVAVNTAGESAPEVVGLLAEDEGGQAGTNDVVVGQSFRAAFDHSGGTATEYRLFRNGVLVQTLPRTALASGVVTFDARTEAAVGSVTYEGEAAAVQGALVAASPRISLTVTVTQAPPVAPPAMTNPRIIKL